MILPYVAHTFRYCLLPTPCPHVTLPSRWCRLAVVPLPVPTRCLLVPFPTRCLLLPCTFRSHILLVGTVAIYLITTFTHV